MVVPARSEVQVRKAGVVTERAQTFTLNVGFLPGAGKGAAGGVRA